MEIAKNVFAGVFVVGVWVCVVAGCASLEQRIAPDAAKAISAYCQRPAIERQALRDEVNRLIQPNSVRITCVGDAQ